MSNMGDKDGLIVGELDCAGAGSTGSSKVVVDTGSAGCMGQGVVFVGPRL